MCKVLSIYQSNSALEGLIREIARDSMKVNLPERESGHIGNIGISRIFTCLESGTISLNPEPNEYKHIVCTLKHSASGDDVYVDLAIDVSAKEIHVLHVSEG